jgi:hypothetical protein
MDFVDYAPPDRLGLSWSLFFVYGVGVLGGVTALALAVARLLHHVRLMRHDREEEQQKPVLQQGHAVLTGVVEIEDPAASAVCIRIEEKGREWHDKNGWHHEWKETARQVDASPFTLLPDTGSRVRVVPDDQVFLIDALSTVEQRPDTRVREARLTNGERVSISGRLVWERDPSRGGGAVYRDAGAALAFRAPRGGRLLISAQSLAARHARWARFYAATAAILALTLGGVHLALGDFHRLNFRGQGVSVPIVNRDTYLTHNKGRSTTHYRVTGLYQTEAVPAQRFIEDVSYQGYTALAGPGAMAPFLVVPGAPEVHQIGSAPGIHVAAGVLLLAGASVGGILFWAIRRSRVPWYEQDRVVERGRGKLLG